MNGEFLRYLQQAGDRGLTVAQLMKSMSYTSPTSVHTSVYRLTQKGYKIVKSGDCLVLKSSPKVEPSNEKVDAGPSHKRAYNRSSNAPRSKADLLFNILQEAGAEGVDRITLAKRIGTKPANLVYHACMLRRKKHKIKCLNGKYYLRDGATKGMSTELAAVKELNLFGAPRAMLSESAANLLMLSPGERESYLENMQKSIYYRKCAEAVIESHSQITTIQKEVSRES